MRFTELEAKIIDLVGVDGQLSLAQIAHAVKAPQHKCRYALEKLFDQGVLFRRVVVNPYLLGLSIYGFWFSLSTNGRAARRKVVEYLASSSYVGYLGEFLGEFEFKVDLYVAHVSELDEFFKQLSKQFGNILARRRFSCTTALYDFPQKHLHPSKLHDRQLKLLSGSKPVALKDKDAALLHALSTIGGETHAAIARRLGMAVSSFEFRVKKLQDSGVIVGYQVWTQAESMLKAGIHTFAHRLRLSGHTERDRTRLIQFLRADPACFSATCSVGDLDAELCSATQSIDEERNFEERLDALLGSALYERVSVPIVKHHKISNCPRVLQPG
jgi:DNA-binding Lrp family transcriptional regulator